jgi:hypothetical protein
MTGPQLVSGQYAIYTLLAQPNSLPAGEALAWIASWILPILIGIQIFFYLLFPTGRLPSDRWKWLAWLTVAFVMVGMISSAFSFGANAGLGPIPNPLGIEGFSDVYDMVLNLLPILYLAVVTSLFVRLHRATGVERQQIKWFAYAAAAAISGIILAYMIPGLIDTPLWFERVGFALNIAVTPAIPVSMDIAILRYRLYEIDTHINRTLVYGSHRDAGGRLLRRHRRAAESGRRSHWREIHPCGGSLHPLDRRPIQSFAPALPVLHRPSLLPP